MRVFISWSGTHSQAVAKALRDWLPDVIQTLEPWMSDTDIHAGDRWSTEIAAELQGSNFGIICVTPSNQASPWLNFEAGAISKNLQEGRVVPYLHALTIPNMIHGPLRQFHAKEADRKGTLEMMQAVNSKLDNPVPADRLQRTFDAMWPKLEQVLANIDITTADNHGVSKSPEDKIDEILTMLIQRNDDQDYIGDLARQIRSLGVIISRSGASIEMSEDAIRTAIFQIVSMQMRAFLKPARVYCRHNENKILFVFGERDTFHYKQVVGKIEELQDAVGIATQYRYTAKVFGPEGDGASNGRDIASDSET